MSSTPLAQTPTASAPGCELCGTPGGTELWHDGDWRVVRVDDAAFPAYYRVVCQRHIAEFSDLSAPQRRCCMELVCAVERAVRDALQPIKINIASLGNVTPHLHWHVIGRFDWDSHFPQPVWASAQRRVEPVALQRLTALLPALDARLQQALRAARAARP